MANTRLVENIMTDLNNDFDEQFGEQIREFIIEWADAAFQSQEFANMPQKTFLEAAKTSICGAIQSIEEYEIFAEED